MDAACWKPGGETDMLAPTLPRSFLDLADDSEESVVGSSLHQEAISALYTGLSLHRDLLGLLWFVGNQLTVVIPREGHRAYRPMPDVFVRPMLGTARRVSLDIATEGPPALAIEVVSPTTVRNDINLRDGKAGAYAHSGIGDYLVFDPLTEHLDSQVWARRLRGREYVPWEPQADGRWHSTALGISFAPLGSLLRIYDGEGTLVPLITEQALLLADRDRRIAEQDRRHAEDRQRIADLEAEIKRLRDR
jgi:Uma2 family endonuclease